MVRFVVPVSLLSRLRQRRRQQREERPRLAAAQSLPEMLEQLFATEEPDFGKAAQQYVGGMASLQEEVEDAHDAFLLDPGMGPMLYLTADGRVLSDGRNWDDEPLREASEEEAIGALVVAAKKTGIEELLDLIPASPPDGETCGSCQGTRRAAPFEGMAHELVCPQCKGRGWIRARLLD